MSTPIYYTPNLEENGRKLGTVQDITSLSLGVGAGILAPGPLNGFLFYLVGYTLANAAFYTICCQGNGSKYFKSPIMEIFVGNILKNVPEYIMMWCLVYALVK
ncbi:ER membrane protein complex subunit 6 [[Candida] anglica]|uniref:ER membrane protein complex subunit 6 n=1 Tax=[Candida] anglica TaxID=148631 RepID=A0ABP0E9J8_9ASCO